MYIYVTRIQLSNEFEVYLLGKQENLHNDKYHGHKVNNEDAWLDCRGSLNAPAKRTVPRRGFNGLLLPVALEAAFSGHPEKQTFFTKTLF
jgi:hypothetical protein